MISVGSLSSRQKRWIRKAVWALTNGPFTYIPLLGDRGLCPQSPPSTSRRSNNRPLLTLRSNRTVALLTCIPTISLNNLFVVLLLQLWTAVCNSQFSVWRADTRTPTEMRAAGLFAPRGASQILQIVPNVSMYNHAVGADNGASRDNDGYVSTTASETTAIGFLNNMFRCNGYVYEIAAAANFIQVSGTLGEFSPYPNEQEYAALGGFSWDQVIRWRHYTNGVEDGSLEDNREYEGGIYNGLRPTNTMPSLAGFPAGHRAWTLSPWNTFAQGGAGCGGGNAARTLFVRQGTCSPKEDAETVAKRFIDENCWAKSDCG